VSEEVNRISEYSSSNEAAEPRTARLPAKLLTDGQAFTDWAPVPAGTTAPSTYIGPAATGSRDPGSDANRLSGSVMVRHDRPPGSHAAKASTISTNTPLKTSSQTRVDLYKPRPEKAHTRAHGHGLRIRPARYAGKPYWPGRDEAV
jgi:hypothetical protein